MSHAARRRAPNRLRARINLVLDPATKARLDRTANAGRYVDFALADRERRWRAAVARLQGAGITLSELCAAREALSAIEIGAPAAAVVAALQGGALAAHANWGIQTRDWAALVHACEAEDVLACAVRDAAQEMDAGNLDIAGAIEGERAGGG